MYLGMQVWSESSDGSGAVNFLTGMGGFLQVVFFGYTGFRRVRIVTSTHIMNPGIHTNTYSILTHAKTHTLHMSVI